MAIRAERRAERRRAATQPGPCSRYAPFPPPPSFGHGFERLRGLGAARSALT